MALLHRFVSIDDRPKTHIYTFIVSRKICKPLAPDIVSRDFTYGQHRWSILFMRRERHVSAYLTIKDCSQGLKVHLDFSFTLLHKEHFTKNEVFSERQATFSKETHTRGCRTFISNEELVARRFQMDESGDYLVELVMRNVSTTFEEDLDAEEMGGGHQASRSSRHRKPTSFPRLETAYFSFGGFDWSVSIYPDGDCPDNSGRAMVYLSRHSGFSHLCKMRYRLTLGSGNERIQSDELEHAFNIEGVGECYELEGVDVRALATTSLHVSVNLLEVAAVSDARIPVWERGKNCAVLYDRDKQKWALVTDIERGSLRLKLFYQDYRNVPRGHLRFVNWSVRLVTSQGEHIPIPGSTFSRHYDQSEDDGYEMKTNISINELKDAENFYLDDEEYLTLHVEWHESYLLLHSNYHPYDGIRQLHNYQMRSEIQALQSENYSLEKQVHSYQMSIGAAHMNLGTTGTTNMVSNTLHNHLPNNVH